MITVFSDQSVLIQLPNFVYIVHRFGPKNGYTLNPFLSLDGRTLPLFGRTYGQKLSSFSFSGLITDENYMFSGRRCGRKFFDFFKYFFYSLLCLLRNHWKIKENIIFFAWQIWVFSAGTINEKLLWHFRFRPCHRKQKK